MKHSRWPSVFVSLLAVCALLPAQQAEIAARIRSEALEHSQVNPVFDMLTVTIGPRLTASPAHKRAAEYVRDRLTSYGLENARLEPWKFGRGWELTKLTVEMTEPRYQPLIGYADGWSASTAGEIVAAPVWLGGKTPEQVAAMAAQLISQGMLAGGLPPDVVARLAREINDILKLPDVREMFTSTASEPAGGTPEEFGRVIRSEMEKWGKILRDANIKVE